MASASNLDTVSTRQQRIATLAKQSPQMGFTSLAYHIDLDWLREAYRRTRKDGAVGVDGQTATDYEKNLEDNLQSLLDRAKSCTYRAPPVRSVHIPKGTGGDTRPIGIPTLEDKVLQRAVVMVLESVYEQDFHDCSYGFRPGRSAHQALDALWQQTMRTGGGWILEVDIRKFFDTLDHAHLRELLQHRVRDGVLLRLIGKWLNAGVLEDGNLSYPEAGSPQGGVISPLLANVYLHYVLDEWFAREVQPRLKGRAFLIRYADDFVIGFTLEEDARRVMAVLPQRFGKYGLTVHPDKTQLVPFRPQRRAASDGQPPDDGPGTFTLLGFTHYWGRSRKGTWVLKRQTAASRFTRALRTITQWCRLHRHEPVALQHHTLSQKLRGHFAYYGITGNYVMLSRFRYVVTRVWRKWLGRRTRAGGITWSYFALLLERYPLPVPTVVHSVYRAKQNCNLRNRMR
jgi:RNA-directed DNA polymerase